MECEILRSPMISYQSLLYNTTVMYDACIDWVVANARLELCVFGVILSF